MHEGIKFQIIDPCMLKCLRKKNSNRTWKLERNVDNISILFKQIGWSLKFDGFNITNIYFKPVTSVNIVRSKYRLGELEGHTPTNLYRNADLLDKSEQLTIFALFVNLYICSLEGIFFYRWHSLKWVLKGYRGPH